MRTLLPALVAGSLGATLLSVAGLPATAAPATDEDHGLAGVHVLRDATGRATSFFAEDGVLAPARAGSHGHAALAFLSDHADAYDMSKADIASFGVDESITDPNGITYVTLAQRANGLPVDQSPLKFAFDAKGNLVYTSGAYARGLDASSSGADVSAREAVRVALGKVGVSSEAPTEKGTKDGRVVFDNDTTPGKGIDHTAEKVVFPVEGGADQVAWRTYVEDEDGESFKVVVDASSGAVLLKESQASHAAPEGRVFTTQHAGTGTRALTSFTGVHGSWVTDRTTTGNNVDAYEDRDENDAADAGGRPETPANGQTGYQIFDYGFTNDWNVNGTLGDEDYTVTQLFYYSNMIHDFMYNLGFTETWRNFQNNNHGLGGLGNDVVLAEARDGYGNGTQQLCFDSNDNPILCRNNANFNTRPDGEASRMQMYLWTRNGRFDGSLDGSVIAHEIGHGLSSRLIANGNMAGNEPRSMGEGWSDIVSFMLWDDPVIAGYSVNDFTQGIRNFSYANSNDDYANYSSTGQVHDQGEIWATAMWRSLVALRGRYNSGPGMDKFRRGVVDGLKLTANPPTMPSGRDAFITALRNANGGSTKDDCLVWVPFARIGLGENATGGGGENYTIPAGCVPTASLTTPVSTPEGTNVQLNASASTLGSNDGSSTLSYAWDLDNDGDFDDATGATPTFTDVGRDGVRTVRVRVTSSSGADATATGTVNVTNVAPAVSGTLSGSTNEGSLVTLNALVSDAGWQDPLSATVNWGDGSGTVPLTGAVENVRPNATITATASHRYGDNGTYTVVICGIDDDASTCVNRPWTAVNVNPTVTLQPLGSTAEGGSVLISASFSDPGWLDSHTATIDAGDGLGPRTVPITGVEGSPGVPDTGTFSFNAPYGDNGSFSVTARVTDDDAGVGTAQGTVNVSNVNPTLAIDKSAAQTVQGVPVIVTDVDQTVPFSSRSTDPGSDDLTLTWDWNDGAPTPDQTIVSLVNPPNTDPFPSPTVQPRDITRATSHRFTRSCMYDVKNAVRDDDGGTAADSVKVAVFDDRDYARGALAWTGEYGYPGKRPLIGIFDQPDSELSCYLTIVRAFSPRFSTTRPVNTLGNAATILNPPLLTAALNARNQLDASILAGWLDIADGSINPGQGVNTDLDPQLEIAWINLLRQAELANANPSTGLTELLLWKTRIETVILEDDAVELLEDLLPW